MTYSPASLLSERRLLRNSAWSVVGASVPLAMAVWAIPRLIASLGTERFGILALVWAGIGYFSLFDMGLGRALTKLTAQRLGEERPDEAAAIARTALNTLAAVGCGAGVLIACGAPWAVDHVLSLPARLHREAAVSFALTALTLPVVISTAGLIGVLQAHQRFAALASLQMALGVATFGAPVAALHFANSLVAVTGALAAARLCGWTAYRWLARDVVAGRSSRGPEAAARRSELFRFGAWVTVSNVIGPLMVYLDRFLVAALITIAAVAYYTTPYEMVTRLWVFADALVAVVFPALSMALARGTVAAERLFLRSTRAMTLLMLVPTGLILLFGGDVMSIWLGPEFAAASAPVLKWLTVGVFINAVTRVPFVALQASGRPDVAAKLHLVELPVYAILAWFLIRRSGIAGAAVAWALRAALDGVLFFGCAFGFLPQMRRARLPVVAWLAGALIVLAISTLITSSLPKIAGALALVAASVYLFLRDIQRFVSQADALPAS